MQIKLRCVKRKMVVVIDNAEIPKEENPGREDPENNGIKGSGYLRGSGFEYCSSDRASYLVPTFKRQTLWNANNEILSLEIS